MQLKGFSVSLLALAVQSIAVNSASAQENQGLEEMVVTGSYIVREDIDMATGLGLSPLETPQSISIMTAQRLRDQGLATIKDVVVNAVGVSSDEVDDVRHTFYARGFEIRNYQIDGVPMAWSLAGDSGETIADTAIYERVEIVRGATGLLTGAGDPSASINLVRKHADADAFTGSVSAGIGSWNRKEVLADVSSPLNEDGSVRGRVVGKYAEAESYVDFYEDKSHIFYGVVEADLSSDTLIRVGASSQKNDPTAPTWGALPTWYSDGTRTDWDRSTTTAAKWTRWQTTAENVFVNLNHQFANGWKLVANYNHLENRQETELLYLFGNVDRETGEGLASWPYKSEGTSTVDSFDFQLKGTYGLFDEEHEFVVGALHSEQEADTTSFAADAFPAVGNFYQWDGSLTRPGFASEGSVAQDLTTNQEGYYASTRLNVSDAFKVILGARVSSWEREGVDYDVAFDFGDDDVVIPYAGLVYSFAEQHSAYFSYTEIFYPQSAKDAQGNYLDPLVGANYEAGLKSSFLDEQLQTTVSVFQVKQDNLAEAAGTTTPTDPSQTPETIYRAIDGSSSEGFEIEVVGEISEGWNIGAGYTQFTAEDADGNDVVTDQPKKLFKLFTSYNFSGDLQGLTIGGGLNWQDRIYSDIVNPATSASMELEQSSYALASLMARYAFNEQLSAQINIHNVTDEKYYSQVGFFDQYRYGDPRNAQLSVTYSF